MSENSADKSPKKIEASDIEEAVALENEPETESDQSANEEALGFDHTGKGQP